MKTIVDLSVTSAPRRSTLWSPAELFSGSAQGAWYDPSDLSTLFQDTAGTVPVATDGDPVALMQDKSGNGNHAVQSVAPARPTWRTDGTLSWLEFDGADDKMIVSAVTYSDPALSICAGVQYQPGGSAWGSIKSNASSVVYVGLSNPAISGSISNSGGQTHINRSVAPNDRIALRNALLSKSVISIRDAQSAQFSQDTTFVAYSSTSPPAALLFGYVEREAATAQMIVDMERWMAGKTGVSL